MGPAGLARVLGQEICVGRDAKFGGILLGPFPIPKRWLENLDFLETYAWGFFGPRLGFALLSLLDLLACCSRLKLHGGLRFECSALWDDYVARRGPSGSLKPVITRDGGFQDNFSIWLDRHFTGVKMSPSGTHSLV